MSNLIVGDIFQKILDEVVSASQTDFEENGVNQQTLAELQQTWQSKLSARSVARMPWDPKPVAAPQVAQPTSSSQGGTPIQAYASQGPPQGDGQAQVKREPGNDASYNGVPGQNYMHNAMNPVLAQQRAASLLQQQFGSQANASLGAMQQRGIALPGQQKPPGNLQLPGQSQQTLQQQYAQQMKQQMRQQTAAQQPMIKMEAGQQDIKPYQQQRPASAHPQTDGAGDDMGAWNSATAATRALSREQIANNDRLMSGQVAELSQQLDSGLMLPMKHQRRRPTRKVGSHSLQSPTVAGPSSQCASIPQLDGEYEEDVKDEEDVDAINSDLDDDDEAAANADEDDDDIDSMLCTYDKVQRVKNKWKCTLKDGVLSANGQEYIFHKAQGEFEW